MVFARTPRPLEVGACGEQEMVWTRTKDLERGLVGVFRAERKQKDRNCKHVPKENHQREIPAEFEHGLSPFTYQIAS